MALSVLSLPVDKPKILFYCAMMAIQNYGFHAMYYDMFKIIPLSETQNAEERCCSKSSETDECEGIPSHRVAADEPRYELLDSRRV